MKVTKYIREMGKEDKLVIRIPMRKRRQRGHIDSVSTGVASVVGVLC